MTNYCRFKYSRLSLSRIPRDFLKHFEISIPRNIRVAEVRKTINWTTTFNKWICTLTPEVRDILKILWKRGEIAPKEQFLLFSTIFCYLSLDFHVKTGTRISLQDKVLFEISEVEIMSRLYIQLSRYNDDTGRQLFQHYCYNRKIHEKVNCKWCFQFQHKVPKCMKTQN